MKRNLKATKGFTLVELLIVISIIIFLIFLAISIFRGQQLKGIDARKKSDLHKISLAVEEYERDNDCYPLPSLVVCNPGTGLEPYIDKIPCDPVTKASYYYEYDDSACPSWYKIYTKLDTASDVDISGNYLNSFNYYAGSANAPIGDISTPAPSSSTSPTSTPQGGGGGGEQFYGCMGGACVPISWDDERPGPACDPNFQNPTCYGQCAGGMNECVSWH